MNSMTLRIKEISKAKGIPMSKIAETLGISPITLSQSLNGNPTLSRLAEVAETLGVEIYELFDHNSENDVYGCIWVGGKPTIISNKDEAIRLLSELNK